MQRIDEALLESVSERVDGQDLERSMISLLHAFEVNRFAYLSFSSIAHGQLHHISNCAPSWTAKYLNQRYGLIDPL